MNKHCKSRVKELNALIGKRRKLTTEEYLEALREIQANYTVHLLIRSFEGKTYDTSGMMHIIDKVHWLIDSVENKSGSTFDGNITIEFAKPRSDE